MRWDMSPQVPEYGTYVLKRIALSTHRWRICAETCRLKYPMMEHMCWYMSPQVPEEGTYVLRHVAPSTRWWHICDETVAPSTWRWHICIETIGPSTRRWHTCAETVAPSTWRWQIFAETVAPDTRRWHICAETVTPSTRRWHICAETGGRMYVLWPKISKQEDMYWMMILVLISFDECRSIYFVYFYYMGSVNRILLSNIVAWESNIVKK
jgi:hypothetical protein